MSKLVFNPNSDAAQVLTINGEQLTVGQAPDNSVCVNGEGIADYHVRFEENNGLMYVVDLGSGAGTFVDGRLVDRFVLGHRAVISIGELEVLYLEEAVPTVPVIVPTGPMALERVAPRPLSLSDHAPCPNCGKSLAETGTACGNCGMILPHDGVTVATTSEVFLPAMNSPAARGAGILPMISFFFGLFGPLILGIGWLLAIIFGFISLSVIRQRGGFMRDRHHAMWGIGFGFTWLAIILAAGYLYFNHRQEQRIAADVEATVKADEAAVASLLKEIAVVEEYLRATQAFPLRDHSSAYATLKELHTVANPFLTGENITEGMRGYLFTIKVEGGDGFVASAVPVHYGETGRKTFTIDQTGVLRGADIHGRQPWEQKTMLPELDMGRSVYLESRERLAKALLNETRRFAEDRKFDRSQFILRELQKNYVLTETFKNFENVAKGIEQLIINAKAQELAEQAKPLLAAGKRAEALALFKRIAAEYPRAANADEVKVLAGAIDAQFAAERNQLAQTAWAKAAQLDKDGKADDALVAYRAFAAQFPDTPTFTANQAAMQASLGRIEESKASGLFASIAGANVQTNFEQVLTVTTQLIGSFPNAPTVKTNLNMLQGLQQQAKSFTYSADGLKLLEDRKYIEAAERLDKAIELNPTLAKDLLDDLERAYFQSGEVYYESNKLVEASAAYEKFLQISPNPEKLEKSKLKNIYLALGEINYLNKNYTNAVSYLKKGVEFFGDNPKYYRMYGQTLLKQKRYAEALPAYQSLIGLAKDDPQAHFERGLCLLGAVQALQTNITAALAAAAAAKVNVAAVEARTSTLAEFVLPPSVLNKRMKASELESLKQKQLELRLRDAQDRLKTYTAQTPEATIIREAIHLVQDIQGSASELTKLSAEAKSEISEGKVGKVKAELLSMYATHQDYFDKIIAEKIATKQDMLGGLEKLKMMLDTSLTDFNAASSIEAYRGASVEISEALKKKQALFNTSYGQMKPALEAELKQLEEARTLIKLAVNQFKGLAIGWNLNDRIEKFFLVNNSDVADKKATAEVQLQQCVAIPVPFEKHIGS